MKGKGQSSEFKPPQRRAVRARRQKSTEDAPSGKTAELHPTECNHDSDTKANVGFQSGSLLEKTDEPQSECAPIQCKESVKEEVLGACEQETNTGLVEILPDVNQVDGITMETVELSDVEGRPQGRSAMECPTTKQSRGAGFQEKELNIKALCPEPQTLQSLQTPPRSTHVSNEIGDDVPCGDAENNKVEEQVSETKDVHSEGVTVDALDERVFDGETRSGEERSVEPPIKRRLRRRMGMCGLGDRKRRFVLEEQPCRNTLTGGEREEEVGAAHEDVLKNDTVEKNNGRALIDSQPTTERVLLEQDASFLEDISRGENQAPLPGEDLNEVKNQPSVPAMINDHETEISATDNEPDITRTETNSDGWDMKFSKKYDALSEEEKLQLYNEVTDEEAIKEMAEDPNEVVKQISSVPVDVIKEVLEDSLKITQKVQTVLIGLEDGKMEIGEQCPPVEVTHDTGPSLNVATTDKPDQNEAQISMPTENKMDLEFMEHAVTVATVANKTAEVFTEITVTGGQCEHMESSTSTLPKYTEDLVGGESCVPEELGGAAAPPAGQKKNMHCLLGQDTRDPSLISAVAERLMHDPTMTSAELPQELNSSVPLSLCSVTDSQLNTFAVTMELEDQSIPEGSGYQEDATELICGLIRELSSLNRTVMAAHREMELLRRGNRTPKPAGLRSYGPRHSEM